MTAANEIETRVNLIPQDTVFSIEDLHLPSDWWENIRVKLGRMVNRGVLKKVGRGRYYRYSTSIFGPSIPNQEEVVKDLLVKDNKIIGYITGYTRWNQMGLTSQISNIIEIGTNTPKKNLKRGMYTIRFVRQPNAITQYNIKYLIILDAINNIRKIPDTSLTASASQLIKIIRKLEPAEIGIMTHLAMSYPPRLRALLGAMLENIGLDCYTDNLYHSLNPLTSYEYPGISKLLANTSKWHIK